VARDVSRETRELIQRGLEHYARGRFNDAISDWETAARLDPGDAQATKLLDFAKRKVSDCETPARPRSRRETVESPIPQFLASLTTESSEQRIAGDDSAPCPRQPMAAAPEDEWNKVETNRLLDGVDQVSKHVESRVEDEELAADTLEDLPVQTGDLEASARELVKECREALRDRRPDAAALAADLALQVADRAPPPGIDSIIEPARALFERAFRACIGDTRAAPIRAIPPEELAEHGFDHRAAFLMSRMDGLITVGDLLDVAGMPRFEALRLVAALRRAKAIELLPSA
jgi:hypothetical protein